MGKIRNILVALVLVVLMAASAIADGIDGDIGGIVTVEQFAPRVFLDNNARIIIDDYYEPGAISEGGEEMIERINNYAFTGERVQWDALVWDKNEKIKEVYVKANGLVESNCVSVNNCFGTPAVDTCSGYNYDECEAVGGCSLACDRYVDSAEVCDGNTPCYPTIQEAIDAAIPGDMICVLPGTYVETGQIVINKDLTIVGTDKPTTIIKPNQDTGSSGDPRGWILVNPGIELNLQHVTLDGSGFKIWQGVRYQGHGSISDCIIKNIKYEESGPSYAGTGVVAFGDGDVDIKDCEFSQIGRVGVLYYGAGITNSEFSGNTYTGKGAGDWLDYGVEVGAGAKAKIENNIISDCIGIASVDSSTSAGILVSTYFGSGTQADITSNEISDSDTGIAVGYDSSDTSIVIAHLNNFLGNNYGVASTNPSVDATQNWWGDSSGPGPVGPGSGDMVTTNVDYTPWATTAFDITIGDGEFEGLPICEGTPTCNLMGSQATCEAVDGCSWYGNGPSSVDFWEGEEHITEFNPTTMQWYRCGFTVEPSMHGQYRIVAGAIDEGGLTGESAESEYWFFNPLIALGINGALNFGTVRPGGVFKSSTLTIGNAAEAGSGVLLDMWIAGTDFYDLTHSGTMCPDSNLLSIDSFSYYASLGAYNTCLYPTTDATRDGECYVSIPKYQTGAGAGINNNMQRIIDNDELAFGVYPAGNVLSPGAEISINFKLRMPEPCNGGSFTSGSIKIFGEAI